MKTHYLKNSLYLLLVIMTGTALGQNTVRVNSSSFKPNLEVAQAQISDQTLMLTLMEIDKYDSKFLQDNCDECPDGKDLLLEVDFQRGFKFPITEKDSVYVRVSLLQEALAENEFNEGQIEDYKRNRNQGEEAALASNADLIKKKGMEISQQLMAGTITPEEAEKQLLALTEGYTEALDNSTIGSMETEEYKERSNYSIVFYNDETMTDHQMFSGYLYIKRFDNERFVAEFQGDGIEQCVEKRAARSAEDEEICGQTESQFLPDAKVLSEGASSIFIDVAIKELLNNR
ncbi:hypothetical protein [Gilvibacter sediminis]|uniref:hypothetical protein n=1 Tax=Gilvibacter sediminis TaxID=379071 RepID=UPI00234FEB7F|nr:hypothetical protein [Gilvibacter sediminis]MDC7996687.1 hypothetical protein [Gilvibacter sediminis]